MPKIFKELYFGEALSRLVVTYNKGKLVPFTGSGISAPSIPTWQPFLENLCSYSNANFTFEKNKIYTSQELIQASEEIVTGLSRESRTRFQQSVKASLGYGGSNPPITDQCKSLSKIWWPLILSTNYDTMFLDALKENPLFSDSQISVFGRNAIDCHSLLASLKIPSKTVYWALQGYIGTNQNGKDLEDEIVVGYRQYRNATYNNQIFRSVFGEIFRNYSLLFLGTALSEDYFRGLFGEVLEKFGSNPFTHCALFNKKDFNSIDHHFLHTKFNITTVFYEDTDVPYDGLHNSIEMLRTAINTGNQKMSGLSFSSKNFSNLSNDGKSSKLEIVAGPMPPPKDDECSVYSAGYGNGILLSNHGVKFINTYYQSHGEFSRQKFIKTEIDLVQRYANTDLYAAIARHEKQGANSHDARDLRIISSAVHNVLKVTNGKYGVINMMLLAAGKHRVFSPVYSLIQMIRGYKKFLINNPFEATLKIHVVDPSVLFYFRTNSLEIEEILNCNDIRLSIEIQDYDQIERYQLYLGADITLEGVSDFYSIKSEFWEVKIIPAAFKNQFIKPDSPTSLENLGLIPGSTIIYTRKNI